MPPIDDNPLIDPQEPQIVRIPLIYGSNSIKASKIFLKSSKPFMEDDTMLISISDHGKGDHYLLSFNYNKQRVEGLKASIPATFRTWDPIDKTWGVHPLAINELVSWLRSLNKSSEVEWVLNHMPLSHPLKFRFVAPSAISFKDRGTQKSAYLSTHFILNDGTLPVEIFTGTSSLVLPFDTYFTFKKGRRQSQQFTVKVDELDRTTLYTILQIPEDADQATIKAGYWKQAQLYHPDKGGDTRDFITIRDAYFTLTDTPKKKKYDFFLVNMKERQAKEAAQSSSHTKIGWVRDTEAAIVQQITFSQRTVITVDAIKVFHNCFITNVIDEV
jgi:hypothetical protein